MIGSVMQIRATQVRDIMTPDPRVIEPSATVREAWATMKEGGFRHLPVVDAGRLVGVISITDIGRERYCTLKQDGFNELQEFISYFDKFWANKLQKLQKILNDKAK